MIIDFDKIPVAVIPRFKGGEKQISTAMADDGKVKIMRASLEPGASIGLHRHETNSEIIYMLQGEGTLLYDGTEETLLPGQAHYCPQGHSHGLINRSDSAITFLGIVPEHGSQQVV